MSILRTSLLIPLLLLAAQISAQNTSNYLSDHAVDITAGISNPEKILDAKFYAHQLFLLGEIHGIQKGQDIDYDFVTLLNRTIQLKTYVAEVDFAKAHLLNKYLETGDEKLIDAVFQDWIEQDAQWGNKDFQDKVRKIRVFNSKLKPFQRIHFEGIDQIQNSALAAGYFTEALKDHAFRNIRGSFNPLIKALLAKNDSLIISTSITLNIEIEQYMAKKQNTTDKGDASKFNDLRYALHNCIAIKSSREGVLHKNFVELFKIREWSREKLYGFFGFAHILLAKGNEGNYESMAYKLQNDNELNLKDRIISIALIYVDSKMMMPTTALPETWREKGKRFSSTDQFNHDGPLITLAGIEDFKSVTNPNTTILFDLRATGSPYLNKEITITYADMMPKGQRLLLNDKGKNTTDYFQYLILIRNSEQTRPIHP